MNDLLNKLSSYNLFNYMLPGTIFAAAAPHVSSHQFVTGNVVVDLFVWYFIGLVISRVGSVMLEPVMKRTGFITFAPYADFVRASVKDEKLDILSEQCNTFRTLCALAVALPALVLWDWLARHFHLATTAQALLACGILFVLFLFAYRKQVGFIVKRVEATNR